MKKLLGIARLELFFSLKRSGFLVYYIILVALLFLFINMMGGAFPSVQVHSDTLKINAQYFIQTVMGKVSLLTTFVVSSFAGMGALRDYRYESHQITFSYPVTRLQYVLGKFSGIYITNMVLFTAPFVGYELACHMPWLERSLFLPFNFLAYWNVYVQLMSINIFFLTAIFFALGIFVRNIVVNKIVIIAFYIFYFLASQYFNQAHTKTLGILLDPYGLIGTMSVSVGQGAEERNALPIPIEGSYLWNRIMWLSVGFLFLLIAALRFRFSYQKPAFQFKWFRSNKRWTVGKVLLPAITAPAFKQNFGAELTVKVFFNQLQMECKQIFKNIYFYIILATAAVFLYFASEVVGKTFETPIYPTTRQVLTVFSSSIDIFIILLLLLFSGESVWRDIQTRSSGIVNSMPVLREVRFAAKTTALYFIVIVMLLVVMFAGLFFQSTQDFHQYELPVYVQYLFGYLSLKYLFYCLLAVSLQSIANNRFQGYAVFALFYVFKKYFAATILQYGVFVPGYTPAVTYSDLTGFQGAFYTFFIFMLYWTAFALLLWRAAVCLFPDGDGEPYKDRWKRLMKNGWKKHRPTSWALAVSFIGLGCFIFYNTNILNENFSEKEMNTVSANYEKQYAFLRKEPQLSISRIDGDINLLTTKKEIGADIKLYLVNKTNNPVSNIYLNFPDKDCFKEIRCNKNWKVFLEDKIADFYGYRFTTPIQPGDSLLIQYHFSENAKGFTDQGAVSLVKENGTFINSQSFIPIIGYNSELELKGSTLRKQFALSEKPNAPLLSDTLAIKENFVGPSADRIWLKLTISTEADQVAIAPGYLQKQWKQNGRAYFAYEMDQPAINYFNIQSGRYLIKTENFVVPTDSSKRPIQLSIYYHPSHNYNLDVMMGAMKDALTYYSREFSPYQYGQLRIVEFPEGSFAQSYANTIAFSENMGFLADLRKISTENKAESAEDEPANFAYFVTVHEVAHQWWAHQILPANTEGSGFLSETMSQYSAIMVVKEKYGEDAARKFLQHYSFEYLVKRSGESYEERPLKTVLDQQYIFYSKGICAMFALQNYLGEEVMNHSIKDFVHQYAFQERPYVTADKLTEHLKAAAPDSLKYLVTDCFDRIVVYDNKIRAATYERDSITMEYAVTVTIAGKKLLYNAKGKAKETTMNDWVQIGILNSNGKQVASQKIKVHSGDNTVRFTSDRRPAFLVINPNFDLQEKEYNMGLRKVAVTKL